MEDSQKWLFHSFMRKVINAHEQIQTIKHLKASSHPHSPWGLRTDLGEMPGAPTPYHQSPQTALLPTPLLWPKRWSRIWWEGNWRGSTPTLRNEVINTNMCLINKHCFVWAISSHQHPKQTASQFKCQPPGEHAPHFPHSLIPVKLLGVMRKSTCDVGEQMRTQSSHVNVLSEKD